MCLNDWFTLVAINQPLCVHLTNKNIVPIRSHFLFTSLSTVCAMDPDLLSFNKLLQILNEINFLLFTKWSIYCVITLACKCEHTLAHMPEPWSQAGALILAKMSIAKLFGYSQRRDEKFQVHHDSLWRLQSLAHTVFLFSFNWEKEKKPIILLM